MIKIKGLKCCQVVTLAENWVWSRGTRFLLGYRYFWWSGFSSENNTECAVAKISFQSRSRIEIYGVKIKPVWSTNILALVVIFIKLLTFGFSHLTEQFWNVCDPAFTYDYGTCWTTRLHEAFILSLAEIRSIELTMWSRTNGILTHHSLISVCSTSKFSFNALFWS